MAIFSRGGDLLAERLVWTEKKLPEVEISMKPMSPGQRNKVRMEISLGGNKTGKATSLNKALSAYTRNCLTAVLRFWM